MIGEPLNLAALGHALRAAFPDLGAITPRRLLGAGFHSVAVETAEGIVFRVARDQDAAAGHRRERRLLPALGPRLSIATPLPRWWVGPAAGLPYGVMGYPLLPGRPLQPELLGGGAAAMVAAQIAAFLVALQRFPTEEAVALGLPGPAEREDELATLRAEALPLLGSVLTRREHRVLTSWWARFLADPERRRYRPVLCHGDLWFENILVDDDGQTVTGVVDWEAAHVGDPAQDFATQLHLGEPFAARVIDAFRAAGGALDAGFPHRLRRLWELREFVGVQLAARQDDAAEFDDAVRKLRLGPILAPPDGAGAKG